MKLKRNTVNSSHILIAVKENEKKVKYINEIKHIRSIRNENSLELHVFSLTKNTHTPEKNARR